MAGIAKRKILVGRKPRIRRSALLVYSYGRVPAEAKAVTELLNQHVYVRPAIMSLRSTIKSAARSAFPSAYRRLGLLKQSMMAPGWAYYADASVPSLLVPERCAVAIAPLIPPTVDTIFIIGCMPGRDFIPFQGRYKLRGIDLMPFDRIKWVCDTRQLEYQKMTAQDFTRTINENLESTLVYTCGTLMQINAKEQRDLYDALKANGCKNFVFLEPPPDHHEFGSTNANRCFQLPEKEFEEMDQFRDDGLVAYVKLSKN